MAAWGGPMKLNNTSRHRVLGCHSFPRSPTFPLQGALPPPLSGVYLVRTNLTNIYLVMAPSTRLLSSRVHVSSINNVSYDVVSTSEADGAVKTILDERRCWRQMKGRDEVVWPPELEAALIEGPFDHTAIDSVS